MKKHAKKTKLRTQFRFLPHTLLLFAILGVAMLVSSYAQSAPAGEFQVFCSVHHTNTDDPIVYPGRAGASHMHSFYGNTTTNAATTTESLMSTRSNCGRGMEMTDHSAYWIPSLYQVQPDGSLALAATSSQTAFIYYQRAGGASGPRVSPIPNGLRMIVGSATATATTPQPTTYVRWSCGGGGGGPQSAKIPTCNVAGQPLHASIDFPNCWDGRSLDSADHKSHMAFPNISSGVCPGSHPISLPIVHLDLDFEGVTGGANYVLSSGGQYSLHADFFSAWDVQVMNALVTECLNTPRACVGIERRGNTIVKPSYDPNPIPVINLANYPSTPLTTGTLPPPPPPVAPPATVTKPPASKSGSAAAQTGTVDPHASQMTAGGSTSTAAASDPTYGSAISGTEPSQSTGEKAPAYSQENAASKKPFGAKAVIGGVLVLAGLLGAGYCFFKIRRTRT